MASGMARASQSQERSARPSPVVLTASLIAGAGPRRTATPPAPPRRASRRRRCRRRFRRIARSASTAIVERVAAAERRRRAAEAQADQDPGDRRLARPAGRSRRLHRDRSSSILKQAIKGLDVVIINRGVSGELAGAGRAADQERGRADRARPGALAGRHQRRAGLSSRSTNSRRPCSRHTRLAQGAQGRRRCWSACSMSIAWSRTSNYRKVRELLRKIAAKENVHDRPPLRGAAAAVAGRRQRRRARSRTSSSAPRRATLASRSTWRARSRSAFSARPGLARRARRRRRGRGRKARRPGCSAAT